jgi:glutathione S-transferase
LGYLDLRYPDLDWRREYPTLARLAEKLGKRSSFQETAPPSA